MAQDVTKYKRADLDAAQRITYRRVSYDLRQLAKLFREWSSRSGVSVSDAYDASAREIDNLVASYERWT